MKKNITFFTVIVITLGLFDLMVAQTVSNSTLISKIQNHILVPGDSHKGLWLGPSILYNHNDQAPEFCFFVNVTDRRGGDSSQEELCFISHTLPQYTNDFNDWHTSWKKTPFPEALKSRSDKEGYDFIPSFNWKYHKASGKWLGIGHLLRHKDGKLSKHRKYLEITWSVYDPETGNFSPWKSFQVDVDGVEKPCVGYGQRIDLDNGDIILPHSVIMTPEIDKPKYWCSSTLLGFDGKELTIKNRGEVFTHNTHDYGFVEPSGTRYKGLNYMTLRGNDGNAHVCTSKDGLHWSDPIPWKWDDGSAMPTRQTMTKFVTHNKALYLVYTRITPDNQDVFRSRAPLFMAQIDPEKLCLLRSTERVIFENRGFPIGNFNVFDYSPDETWIRVAEWDRTGKNIDCNILLARIIWSEKNTLLQ